MSASGTAVSDVTMRPDGHYSLVWAGSALRRGVGADDQGKQGFIQAQSFSPALVAHHAARFWTCTAALDWTASMLKFAQVRTNAGETPRAVVRVRCHFRAVYV